MQRCPLTRDLHLDVIPHPCAIECGPITAEHLKHWSVANGYTVHKGEKVVGNATGILPDADRGMRVNEVDNAGKRSFSCLLCWIAGQSAPVPPLPWCVCRD